MDPKNTNPPGSSGSTKPTTPRPARSTTTSSATPPPAKPMTPPPGQQAQQQQVSYPPQGQMPPQGAYPPPAYPPMGAQQVASGAYYPQGYPPMYGGDPYAAGMPPGNYAAQGGGYPPQGQMPPQGAYPPNYPPQGAYQPQSQMPPQGAYPPAGNYAAQGGGYPQDGQMRMGMPMGQQNGQMPGGAYPPVPPEDTTPANFQLGTKFSATLNVTAPKSELKYDAPYFIRLLAGSISLSKDEKKKIIESIPKLKQAQIDELIRIFEEEKQKFAALSKKHVPQLEKLAQQHFDEWMDLEHEWGQTQKKSEDSGKAEAIRKQLGL